VTRSTPIRYLRDYVAIPSVNPMGRTDIDPAIAGEWRYAEHLCAQLRGIGLDAELIGDPARPSVLAQAHVPGATDTLILASHLDTVPVDGMEIAPFDPVIATIFGSGPSPSGSIPTFSPSRPRGRRCGPWPA